MDVSDSNTEPATKKSRLEPITVGDLSYYGFESFRPYTL